MKKLNEINEIKIGIERKISKWVREKNKKSQFTSSLIDV